MTAYLVGGKFNGFLVEINGGHHPNVIHIDENLNVQKFNYVIDKGDGTENFYINMSSKGARSGLLTVYGVHGVNTAELLDMLPEDYK